MTTIIASSSTPTASVRDAFARACEADAANGLRISQANESEVRLWIETVADAFVHPDTFDGPPPTETFSRDAIEEVFSDFGTTPGVTLYLARRDSAIAGGGSLRSSDGLAQLAGAATLPAHRRRGVQSALLRARLLDAANHGCDLAVVASAKANATSATSAAARSGDIRREAYAGRGAPQRDLL